MGNCFGQCLGKLKARKFLRTKYNDKDYSVEDACTELPQSMESDDDLLTFFSDDELWPILPPDCTPANHHFQLHLDIDQLMHEQKEQDAIIATKLAQDEDELRLEEEAFNEASPETILIAKPLRVAKLVQSKGNSERFIYNMAQKSKLGNNNKIDWNIFQATCEYDIFNENENESQDTKQGQNSVTETISTSSSVHKDRTFSNTNSTPPSEVELEWDNESGIVPGMNAKPRSRTEEDLASWAMNSRTTQSSPSSIELEWENDFVRAEAEAETSPDQEMTSLDLETEHLISEIEKLTSLAVTEEVIQEER